MKSTTHMRPDPSGFRGCRGTPPSTFCFILAPPPLSPSPGHLDPSPSTSSEQWESLDTWDPCRLKTPKLLPPQLEDPAHPRSSSQSTGRASRILDRWRAGDSAQSMHSRPRAAFPWGLPRSVQVRDSGIISLSISFQCVTPAVRGALSRRRA